MKGISFCRRVLGAVIAAFWADMAGPAPAWAKLDIRAANGSSSEDGWDEGTPAAASACLSCLICSSGDGTGCASLRGPAVCDRGCIREVLGALAVAVGVGRSVCSPTKFSSVGLSGNGASGGSTGHAAVGEHGQMTAGGHTIVHVGRGLLASCGAGEPGEAVAAPAENGFPTRLCSGCSGHGGFVYLPLDQQPQTDAPRCLQSSPRLPARVQRVFLPDTPCRVRTRPRQSGMQRCSETDGI